MTVWPVQHAKAHFSELLDACQRDGPQVVSRRGAEAAVPVPIEQWQRPQAAARPILKHPFMTYAALTQTLAHTSCPASPPGGGACGAGSGCRVPCRA